MRYFLVLPILLIIGCSEAKKSADGSQQPQRSSAGEAAKLAVDGVTGRYAVNAGTQAMNKIKDISAREKKDLDDVMK